MKSTSVASLKLSPLIVALDLDNLKQVERLVIQLGAEVSFYKVGLKLFIRHGPEVLKFLQKKKKQIFLDLKLHDIPNTVAEACREAVRHKVQLLTLHTLGGTEMMRAAVQAVRQESKRLKIPKPKLLGVTVLTSMDERALREIGISRSLKAQVLKLAQLAYQSGMDGVVCSPQELTLVNAKFPKAFLKITPGIRPVGSALGDQKRVMGPSQAYQYGADALVVGRPILQAKNPIKVVQEILWSIKKPHPNYPER